MGDAGEGAAETAQEGKRGAEGKGPEKKKIKKQKRALTINLTHCRYDSVRRVAKRCGLQPVVGEGDDWTVYWVDTSVMMDKVMDMKRYQKINHFPGMGEICRKDLLGRNLTRMRKLFPKEYSIFPHTWVMPGDYSDFQAFCRLKSNKTFISKPESGSQGKGIVIFKNPKDIKPGDHCVVQQYISKPFIIDGFKFDFRVYVLVTSCDPLRVYVYKDGLGRFATIKYRGPTHHNLDEVCLHLTNYSINKDSDDFVRDDISGSKRRLSTVDQWFTDNGYDINKIWASIEDVIIKTLVSAHTVLRHNYRSCFPSHNRGSACFEILGFDVLLDHKLKPWIIEVNLSPSFHTDSPLDKEVKEGLLHDTFQLIDLHANDKRRCQEEDKRRIQQRLLTRQKSTSCREEEEERERYASHLQAYEKKHMGGFRRIYPQYGDGEDPYTKFFDQSTSLCAETAASRARAELARVQRQEIEQKAKEEERIRSKLAPGGDDRERGELGAGDGEGEGGQGQGEGGRKPRVPLTATRRAPFRLTTQPSRKKTEPQRLAEEPGTQPAEPSPIPLGEAAVPQAIDEAEERQRLAGLQLRDRLIRGLDLPYTITSLLATPQSPPPLPTSLMMPTAPTNKTRGLEASEESLWLPPYTQPASYRREELLQTYHITPGTVQPLLPPRRHHSTYHSHHLHTMSAGRSRPGQTKPSHPPSLRSGQALPASSLRAPVETFGLLVSAAPVANRSKRPSHSQPHGLPGYHSYQHPQLAPHDHQPLFWGQQYRHILSGEGSHYV